jgi:oxygen-independent coproporphyrinogen-3 oxidase
MTKAGLAHVARPVSRGGIEGLYVHIPFCERRCHYCDFNTYEGLDGLKGPYTEALIADIRACAERGIRAVEGGLRSVYFGGGTPSSMEPQQLLAVLEAARGVFGLRPDAELSLEVNPGGALRKSLERLRRGGFNRISFGFQAAQDRHLQALGRVHNVAQSEEAWEAARAAGFDNLSLDLIFGLSGQTREEWRESLDWALARRPEHVSFYGLTVEPGTRFHHWRSQGRLPLPDEDLQAEMYEEGAAVLAAAGLRQYEISNFARPGRESVHNRLYWLNAPTLGVGAGAWSWVDGERSGRIKQPQAYMDALAAGRDPRVELERLEGRAARAEAAFLRLRLNEGIDLAAWKREHGTAFDDDFGPALERCRAAGCLEEDSGYLRLTPKGRLLANEVFSALL